ncbi:DNA cytosine methyltransferase [Trinickia sp. EG282A]|uniref:DNA cytosine methyltransferase n=1 Tax=Trinickia sp. EG282A TaxID=3237013 RepID=UPI0034D377F1
MKAVDLFAGGGGFSTGAKAAGVEIVWAGNHSPLAVQYHANNHPEAIHVCQDLHQADWTSLPSHDVMLASPCCQGHTPARGKDRPYHDKQRNTAWAVVSCAEYHQEYLVVVENVVDFIKWQLYPAWLQAMNALGYAVAPHVIDAADHGVPQNRERLFLICTRSKNPLRLSLPKRPHIGIGTVIEWGKHRWSPVEKPNRSQATLKRIAAGRARFGKRFVAPYYGSGSGTTGRSIDRPIGTITTLDRWAIIDGEHMRMLQPPEVIGAMGFPADYHLPPTRREAIHLLGNAVCPPVVTDLINEIKLAA